MDEIKQINKNNEGIKFLCLSLGFLGIILYIISIFTTSFLMIISVLLFILGIVFSAIYKSIVGIIINIVGLVLIPIIIFISAVFLTRNTINDVYKHSMELNDSVNENNYNDKNQNSERPDLLDEFYKYFNNKNIKIIYYSSSTCGYCSLETPIMEQIAKDYGIDYLTIDSTKLTTSDREKILKELDIEHATPTTVVVKNSKVLGTQVGYVDGKDMVEFLKENNVLNNNAEYTPEKYLTFINYDQYTKILEQSGKYIITIGQTGCSHCIATKPVLNSISKDYNITINYLNITEMTSVEMNSFINSLSEIGYDDEDFVSTGSFGTPLTLIIENGKVISYVSGERPSVQFINAFKKVGIIPE